VRVPLPGVSQKMRDAAPPGRIFCDILKTVSDNRRLRSRPARDI
jgi:hypothetical protein